MPYRVTERAEQRRQAMRQRLIQAACILFVRQGYAATTMQQIVQEAGTSIGNCYFYFSNKEALLQAVVEDFAQQIGLAIDAAISDMPPGPEQLAVALAHGVKAALAQADLARVLLVEVNMPRLRTVVLNYFAARLPYLLEEGEQHRDDTQMVMTTLAWQGAVFQILEAAIRGSIDADATAITHFLIRWNLRAIGIADDQIADILNHLAPDLFSSGREGDNE
jgi:AcrR family transcriptional regulator